MEALALRSGRFSGGPFIFLIDMSFQEEVDVY